MPRMGKAKELAVGSGGGAAAGRRAPQAQGRMGKGRRAWVGEVAGSKHGAL